MKRVTRSGVAAACIAGVGLVLMTAQARAHSLQKDTRVVRDRLHRWNNPDQQDYSFLNGVGAVWPEDFGKSAIPYDASSGFLIDRCHVLTTLHAVYKEDLVVHPAPGKAVSFGVGQTEGETNRGAARGFKYLLRGVVVAYGDTTVVDQVVQRPGGDWALIHLATKVDAGIPALAVVAPAPGQLLPGAVVAAAGFPSDHRSLRADGFNFKDLWGSTGTLVEVTPESTVTASAQTTVQATRGMSGGPLYVAKRGVAPVAIGMVQSIRGNGLDVSMRRPNVELLFTPHILEQIAGGVTGTPCQ